MPNGNAYGHGNAAQNFHNGTANNPNNNGANGHSIAMDNVPFLSETVFGFDLGEFSSTPGTNISYYSQGDFIATVPAWRGRVSHDIRDWDGDGDLEYSTMNPGANMLIEHVDGDTFEFSGVSIEDYDNDGAGLINLRGTGLDGSSYGLYFEFDPRFNQLTIVGSVNSSDGTYEWQRFQNFDDAFDFVFTDHELTQLSVYVRDMALDDFILV
ncbi:hypothetical protein E7681_11075 [Thalassobius vesicularis]|uniref:Uncharacterized protein n=1 Tax=Thalassobius vesicularis TaxID=1294297 RepID=A0A4S3M7A6_9RHOB|nr:hypothetical protein [Thalassobius vesicularis]THD73238.1 hypothetical protein E7681_11075 [Thalassobius vesicularis]